MKILLIFYSVFLTDLPTPLSIEYFADKGITFLVLAVIVYFLWKRDNATQEKLDKYLTEDRAEMKEIINDCKIAIDNNTRVVQQFLNSKTQ